MKLIIVESPTKAKTISSFIKNKEYKVISSYGHVRDLPKSKLGIDIENNFEPKYVIPTKVRKRVSEIKREAKKTNEIILATDEDREGEAIAWHISYILDINPNKTKRIVFHEITEQEIKKSLLHPRHINFNLVNAQQARRILDRLVGYKLSPLLWDKIAKGLSAGRVQSVALKIIVDREKEIEKFKQEEYWSISVQLNTNEAKTFLANLIKINDKKLEKTDIKDSEEANKLKKDLEKAKYLVSNLYKKITKKHPLPPFITSSLQQEAYKRLGFSSKQTMRLAQFLYENGLITYMRTDSYNLSSESINSAKKIIKEEFGNKYSLESTRVFKKKSKGAQEAHEAIRPTNPNINPIKNRDIPKIKDEKEFKLYNLIWRRFIASQMQSASFFSTKIEIIAESKNKYMLTTSGNIIKFDGFLKIWESSYSENQLPDIKKGENLTLVNISVEKHLTQPPPRYNEASLIKTLEEYGIGRPSTYAPIISVIQDRNYVTKNEQRRFEPTEIGIKVNNLLTENFQDIVNINFTAKMEKELDEISEGKKDWKKIIKEFYIPFENNIKNKQETIKSQKPKTEQTNIKCDKCGAQMVIKYSRYGRFLACSNFPKCKNTKSLPEQANNKTNIKTYGKCPKCKIGNIVRKRTRKGRFFYGCSKYPNCDYATWTKPKLNE